MERTPLSDIIPRPEHLADEANRSVADALRLLHQAHQTNDETALTAAAQASDILQRAHSVTGGLRIMADRRTGELIRTLNPDDTTLNRSGINPTKRTHYTQISLAFPEDHSAIEHIRVMVANGKDVSPTGAKKLVPRVEKPERASYVNGQYVAPSITVEVARTLAGELGEDFSEFLVHSINDALKDLPERQARAWLMRHGITEDGAQGDTWTFDAIGMEWGKTREYAQTLYWQADRAVARAGWRDALHALKEQLRN